MLIRVRFTRREEVALGASEDGFSVGGRLEDDFGFDLVLGSFCHGEPFRVAIHLHLFSLFNLHALESKEHIRSRSSRFGSINIMTHNNIIGNRVGGS